MLSKDRLKNLAEGTLALVFAFGVIVLILYVVDFIVTLACPCINTCVGCYLRGGICQYSGIITLLLILIFTLAIFIGLRKVGNDE